MRNVDFAIDKMEKKKEDNYRDLVVEGDAIFLPFVLDVHGKLNKAGEDFLIRLSSLASSRNSESQKSLLSSLRLQLSFKVLSAVAFLTVQAMEARSSDDILN